MLDISYSFIFSARVTSQSLQREIYVIEVKLSVLAGRSNYLSYVYILF